MKALKIILFVILGLALALAIAFGVYCYINTHYWQGPLRKTLKAGFAEKQATAPDGSVINYAEGPDNGAPLLLIHGQTGDWTSYTKVLPELSKSWHIFAVDCYGHGKSSHDETKYYIDQNCDDLIWFIDNVIGEKTVVSGHSSGALMTAYIAAYGGENVAGAVLEDPPVFSTEPDYFPRSFAYLDTYKVMHEYNQSDKSECWPAYYLRRCLWGQLFMPGPMPKLADSAQSFADRHPGEPVEIFYMPASINQTFLTIDSYDFMFGEHFYDYTWHAGISQAETFGKIKVPSVFIHALDAYTPDGTVLMAASSNEQARRAVSLIEGCRLVELKSDHLIHWTHPDTFIDAVNSLLDN